MPFIPHTPESLLPRSDSKNPASTCRGLTSNGRSCRRPISKSPQSSPRSSSQGIPSPEAFCWQHREQAPAHTAPIASPQRNHGTIRERTSVDTLVDRLGLLEIEQKKERRQRHNGHAGVHNEKISNDKRPVLTSAKPNSPERRRPQLKKQSNLLLLCCIGEADEGNTAPRPVKNSRRNTNTPVPQKPSSKPPQTSSTDRLSRPSIARDPSSRTGEFLSLIPPATSPQTTALLLSELAKPFSQNDDAGFIYMFWLTPESLPADAPTETAPSLLAAPSRPKPGHRRTSDVLNTFSITIPDAPNKKTMLLKIGRAQNVQRRLNQWTRQCGYNVSLIRYYPYHSSSTVSGEPPRTPKKVPNVNKVERLIHLELGDKKVQSSGKCGTCGREHREWFEADASRDGVKAVDEVIRRWVDWSEREATR